MSNYSLSRVAHYARYHYVSNRNTYVTILTLFVVMPVLFGMLSGSIETTAGVASALYVFSGFIFAVRSTMTMRQRGHLVLDATIPVSPAERFTFMLFNLTIVAPLCSVLTSVVALFVTSLFSRYGDFVVGYHIILDFVYLDWYAYVGMQILAASSLLLNFIARRSLVLTYIMAFIAMLLVAYAFASLMESIDLNIDISNFDDTVAIVFKSIYIAIPIIIYGVAYIALRRRQIKW